MHGGKYALRAPHSAPVDGWVEWLPFPVEKTPKDVTAWLPAPLHDVPGAIAHSHIGMPNGSGNRLVIARHTEINLPRIGGKVGTTEGGDGIEQKERAVGVGQFGDLPSVHVHGSRGGFRSEERRVGKECRS